MTDSRLHFAKLRRAMRRMARFIIRKQHPGNHATLKYAEESHYGVVPPANLWQSVTPIANLTFEEIESLTENALCPPTDGVVTVEASCSFPTPCHGLDVHLEATVRSVTDYVRWNSVECPDPDCELTYQVELTRRESEWQMNRKKS